MDKSFEKKQILILSEDFPPYSGGIAQWASGVASGFSNSGYEVRVLTRFRKNYPPNSGWIFPIHVIQGNRWKQFRTWYCARAVKRLVRNDFKPSVIIATTWNVARGLVSFCRQNKIFLVVVTHGLEVTRKMSSFKRNWLIRTFTRCDCIFAVSRFTRDRLIDRFPVSPEKVMVFPNGVDADRFHPLVQFSDFESELDLGASKIILTLARVVERKGHDQVIRALPKVLKRIPKLVYVIAGPWDEAYYLRLKSLITELGLESVVRFTGYLDPDSIPKAYALCDVYTMPCRELKEKGDTEGFGITFLEANACGKPVIGGRSGGVIDAIVDGETGYLVDPTDPDEIADKLIRILSDPSLASRLGRQGRIRVEQGYTWDCISEKMMACISEL
jgi:phosphatidylinositol alpha-1,6-mannosyltransferase